MDDDEWQAPEVLVAVDLVIFTLRESGLNILLVERGVDPFRGSLALPGGFLRDAEEDILAAARRELAEEAGLVDVPHLEQLGVYGEPGRDPRGRVISVAYLAIAPGLPEPLAGTDAAAAWWTPVERALGGESPLAFDHRQIITDGLERARGKLEHSALATAFCAEPFTISDLQAVYEAVWGVRLDPRNFYRKVQNARGFIVAAGGLRKTDSGRPARLFRAGPHRRLVPPMLRTHQRPEEDEPVTSDHPVVILTALDLEYDAVRRYLADPRLHRHNAGTRFEVGRLTDGTPIALGLVGKGNHPAAVLAERAIHEFTPTAVLFVGVAGALWPAIGLGTVVVATHVYAYHGGTSEDDGFKARPRVWEIAHQADQVARHVKRTGDWARDLPDGVRPDVTFGPIAAGEVVQDSAFSAHAAWVRDTYNDAVAIEMEGAGIAQAAHLNLALPAVIVRGISDLADGSKTTTDGQNWQPAAARNAAAFAVALALAGELSREVRTNAHRGETMQERITNFAGGHARVAVQAGQIHGNVTVGQHRRSAVLSLEDQVEEFRRELRGLHGQDRIDSATLDAVRAELAVVVDSSPTESLLALKKIYGLVLELPELTALVTAMLDLVRGRS